MILVTKLHFNSYCSSARLKRFSGNVIFSAHFQDKCPFLVNIHPTDILSIYLSVIAWILIDIFNLVFSSFVLTWVNLLQMYFF